MRIADFPRLVMVFYTKLMSLEGMSGFWLRFPEVAAQETRTIKLLDTHGGLPADSYGFLELYCNDPACDCRRVLLQVRTEAKPDKILATINYGWESLASYRKWLHGDLEGAREIGEASLDPMNPQSRFAPELLRRSRRWRFRTGPTFSGSHVITGCSRHSR